MDARPIVVAVRVGGPAGVPAAVPMAANVNAAPVQPQPDASYRLNHKKLHLTMAALGVGELSNEAVLAMAKRRGNLIEFSIGNEVHATPANPARPHHKHFYLRYEKPINHASIFPRGQNDEEQEGIDSRVRVSQYMIHDLRRNPGPNARGAPAARAPHP